MKPMRWSILLILITFQFLQAVAQDTCVTSLPYGNNPQAGRMVKLNGINIYYEIYGPATAPPLLLIHGNGGSIRGMRCQIEHFKQQYRVVIADSRYHGKSENGDQPLSYELIAEDYAALLKYLHLDSVNVIGQSDGAIITLLLALNHPEKIKKGIAMAPNLRPDSTALYGYNVRFTMNQLDSVNQLLALGNQSPELLRKQVHFRLMVEQPNIPTKALTQIQVPILLMAADGDIIKLEHILEMYRALPKANLLVMPATTHRMLREEYRLFNQICQRFLDTPFKRPFTIF